MLTRIGDAIFEITGIAAAGLILFLFWGMMFLIGVSVYKYITEMI